MCKIPKLFDLMAERKVTAYKLSKNTGISNSNLSDWKLGKSQPSSDKLKILADYFGVSTDYLLGKATKPNTIDEELGDFEFALFGEVKDFSDAQKRDLLKLARFLKDREKENDDN